MFRRVVFWIHLVTGISVGAIVMVMSVTGALLTYEKQVIAWTDTRGLKIEPAAGPRLTVDALVEAARAGEPEHAPTAMTVWSDPGRPVSIAFGGRAIFLDPYSGRALGEASAQPRALFRTITDWHRWLGASGESRATARAITGASNLAFLALVITGAYLWLPKVFSWVQLRNVLWFRRGLPGKARDFNWHNTLGAWSVIPLIVVVSSGVVMSYPWANALVYRVAGEAAPPRPRPAQQPRGAATKPDGAVPRLDAVWARAVMQVPEWRSISMRVPPPGSETAVFTIDRGTGGEPQKRGTLTLRLASAEVGKWEPFSALTPVDGSARTSGSATPVKRGGSSGKRSRDSRRRPVPCSFRPAARSRCGGWPRRAAGARPSPGSSPDCSTRPVSSPG